MSDLFIHQCSLLKEFQQANLTAFDICGKCLHPFFKKTPTGPLQVSTKYTFCFSENLYLKKVTSQTVAFA